MILPIPLPVGFKEAAVLSLAIYAAYFIRENTRKN